MCSLWSQCHSFTSWCNGLGQGRSTSLLQWFSHTLSVTKHQLKDAEGSKIYDWHGHQIVTTLPPNGESKTIQVDEVTKMVAEFSGLLWMVCEGRIEKYACLPQLGAGLCFRLVSARYFESLLTKAPNVLFKANGIRVLVNGAKESGPFCKLPHPLVSTWLINQKGFHLAEL